ncbi:MAG: hypothetical protein M3O70_22495 [Actinomycetota bacterium]|nr:hypothetical protein [Actinomycetota bacterium]
MGLATAAAAESAGNVTAQEETNGDDNGAGLWGLAGLLGLGGLAGLRRHDRDRRDR